MGVVCEGVETEEQLAVLSGLGGTLFQGYFFARPMGVEEFPAWLTSQREGH